MPQVTERTETVDGAGRWLITAVKAFVESGVWAALSPAETKILMVLLRGADGDGQSYRSVNTLADKAGLARRSAIRALNQLEGRGIIRTGRRNADNGAHTSALRKVIIPSMNPSDSRDTRASDRSVTSEKPVSGHVPSDTGDTSPSDSSVTRLVTQETPPSDTPVTTLVTGVSPKESQLKSPNEEPQLKTLSPTPPDAPPSETNDPPEAGGGGAGGRESCAALKIKESRFPEFWEAWPENRHKVGEEACRGRWDADELDAEAEKILAALAVCTKSAEWKRESGRFVPKPLRWLRDREWLAVSVPKPKPAAAKPVGPPETDPDAAFLVWKRGKAQRIWQGMDEKQRIALIWEALPGDENAIVRNSALLKIKAAEPPAGLQAHLLMYGKRMEAKQ